MLIHVIFVLSLLVFNSGLFYSIPFSQVEEIDDIEGNSSDPFVAAAIANEKELDLSEEQKSNFRKVC